MASQVAKWGHSLGIRIPAPIAKQANLKEGTAITFAVVEGNIVIRPRKNKYTLDELLEGMTPDNVHSETDMGGAIGNEVW